MSGCSDNSFNPLSPRNSSSLLHPASRRRQVTLKVAMSAHIASCPEDGWRTLQHAALVSSPNLLPEFRPVASPISHIVVYTDDTRCEQSPLNQK